MLLVEGKVAQLLRRQSGKCLSKDKCTYPLTQKFPSGNLSYRIGKKKFKGYSLHSLVCEQNQIKPNQNTPGSS